ncbi:MAG TPA: hypothetical protein VD994_19905 [Prosthecobacter sp.]|nr:hypothetical protein [Prosthecobacter sp.]
MLPADVARCPGEMYVPPTMDFACMADECMGCARRTEGVRDYMAGASVTWMTPPGKVPCPERLEPKK